MEHVCGLLEQVRITFIDCNGHEIATIDYDCGVIYENVVRYARSIPGCVRFVIDVTI